MPSKAVLEFDNFRLTQDGFEFDAFNEVGRLPLIFDRSWVSDNVGDGSSLGEIEDFFLSNRDHIENAAIALVGALPQLGKPLGDVPYSGFAKAPFHLLRVR